MNKIVLSEEQTNQAFSLLSSGESLETTRKALNLSSKSMLLSRLTDTPEHLERYRASLISKGALFASEIVDIADDLEIPVDRAKLMMNARQWVAGKMLPAIFGAENAMRASVNVGADGSIEARGPMVINLVGAKESAPDAEKVIDIET